MYTPTHFDQQDEGLLRQAIARYPLATLVVTTPQGLEANHIPLYLVEEGGRQMLRGHIARTNPLWQDVAQGSPALAVFTGPEGYISPNWYPTKAEDGKVVPTWNYLAVHASGKLRFIEDADWLLEMLSGLTELQEAGQADPWQVEDAPKDFTRKLVRAIVGIELEVTRLQGKWKLSQNLAQANRTGAIGGTLSAGRQELAREMTDAVKQ